MNEGQKNLPTKEIFNTARQTVALQTRLVLGGEALNPNKINLGKITPEQLSEIKPTTIVKINQASTKERLDYWKDKGTFDQQLKSWCDSMVRYYNDPRFTEKEALKLYHHYFGENKGESNINIYADEIIANFTQNEKINFDQLNQNLPEIKKRANIFGGNSAEIIEDLILARAKLTDPAKKQELIEQVNEEKTIDNSPTLRLNYLNSEEKMSLRWLFNEKPIVVTTPPSPQPEPPEPKPPVLNPWENIPKPKQPIIIHAGKVERDAQGRRTRENAEVKLILGTAEYPLVTENKWSDGRIEKVRTTSPERPYHIPAVVYFDEDINDEQRRLINQAVGWTLSQIGVPKEFIIVSDRSASEFFSRLHPSVKRNNQYDASLLLYSFSQDRDQIEHPHHAIVFTNKDLYTSDTNFVVGAAQDDLGTVISLHRFWNSVPDTDLRNEVVKTEISHEIGHVFGLPSNRRGENNIENSLGPHCKNDGCCMKQGLRVPDDWIKYTRDRLDNLGRHHYCQDCQTDLQEKFKKK